MTTIKQQQMHDENCLIMAAQRSNMGRVGNCQCGRDSRSARYARCPVPVHHSFSLSFSTARTTASNLRTPSIMATKTNSLQQILWSDDQIIDACRTTERWCIYPSREDPLAFIKFGAESTGIMAEMRNQAFVLEKIEQMSESDTKGIRVPKIYRVFNRDRMVFIVMEYIHGYTLKEVWDKALLDQDQSLDRDQSQDQERFDQITRAIKLFLSIEIPIGVDIGPIGGGIIKHPLFKDSIASIPYSSVDELQLHINKVSFSTVLALSETHFLVIGC
jgi:hypothetical protein